MKRGETFSFRFSIHSFYYSIRHTHMCIHRDYFSNLALISLYYKASGCGNSRLESPNYLPHSPILY